ncbi:MAG: FRG domain-containing protein, partial [Nitrososphaera sp.]|nr:FRG domain-containing protein [Nitrososphaera sp.]
MTDSNLIDYLSSEYAHDWKQVNDFYENHFQAGGQWVFRGQGDNEWGLKSSLERQIEAFGIDSSTAYHVERGLLRRFKRQCHHYIPDVPDEQDHLEWLALMQHHGTPTRLLDWTYSFFVALFFALDDADKNCCAIWALNTDWMKRPFESVLTSYREVLDKWTCDAAILQPDTFDKIFLRDSPIALAGAVTPQRMNQRLVIQQGTFLCPGDVSKSFETNLLALLSKDKAQSKANFIKLTVQVDLDAKKNLLLRLHRMN